MSLTTPIEDRLAIHDLLPRYAWALDTGDDVAYMLLFTPDGAFIQGDVEHRGREALGTLVRELSKHQAPGNRHHNTQILFEEGDHSYCRLRSYSTHIYEPVAGQPQVIRLQGYYRDLCVKVDGVWYFAERAWDVWQSDRLVEYRPPARPTEP